jgi:hypothetical protein
MGGGGGGARPSFGGGGGGARPSMGGGGGSRPSAGGGSRPSMSRPPSGSRPNIGQGSGSRPSLGSGSGNRPNAGNRPDLGNRPGLGNINPGVGGGNRPVTRPGNTSPGGNRPNIRPPSSLPPTNRPVTLPGNVGGNRPVDRPTTLPGRPGVGGGDRPGIGGNRPIERPTTLPGRPGIGGDRPGINRPERPIVGGGNRPGIGDRPGIGNRPDRPIIGGGNRPGIGNGNINRPNIGGGNNNVNVNRPNIGGGNNNVNVNRPIIGGGNNVNVNRPVVGVGVGNINNRPGWGIDPGFSRPHWGNYWQSNCVRPNYNNWYHGCWHGHWSNYWYVPLAAGATAWSLGALTSSWGYGPTYVNPYYSVPATGVVASYDYSQPMVVNNYASADSGADPNAAPQANELSPELQQSLTMFDEARAAFKNGEYSKALAKVTVALQNNSQDPILHEFRALTLFATGDFKEAAAVLNSLLASAPGMDWTTMSGLYGNVDDYTKQLQRLEDFCKSNPNDASARFVLAYHYLVLGHTDEAIKLLKRVVELQPNDATAKRMLAGLSPPMEEAAPAPAADAPPETDLVGSWKAKAGESVVELSITEESKFTWKATMPNQPVKELEGTLSASADTLSLDTEKAGSMVGSVKSGGADKFTFLMQGMLPTDPGLVFERVL